MGAKQDVFISYSSPDREFAEAALAALEGAGIRCWIAPRDIVPGADWGATIVSAISDSRVLVLVYSSRSNDSPQVLREVERSVSKRLTILPLRIEDVAPTGSMEYFLGACHWLDAFEPPFEKHLGTLVAAVRAALERAPEATAVRAPGSRRGRGGLAMLAVFLIGLVIAGAGARWALSRWHRPEPRQSPVARASPSPAVKPSPSPSPTAAPLVRVTRLRADRVVDPGGVDLRKGPSASSPSVGRAEKGDLVLVLEESPDWLRVAILPEPGQGRTLGHVERRRLRPTNLKPTGLATISDPDGYTNVRAGPGLTRPVVAKVREREVMLVLGSGEWVHVVTRKGVEGYMHRSRIRPLRPS